MASFLTIQVADDNFLQGSEEVLPSAGSGHHAFLLSVVSGKKSCRKTAANPLNERYPDWRNLQLTVSDSEWPIAEAGPGASYR